jgi:hypothetical protein
MDEREPYSPVTREGILLEAQRLHDLRYGVAHCDRKYVQVCSRFQEALFEAGQNVRPRSGRSDPQPTTEDAS